MVESARQIWWLIAIRGVLAVIFGLLALAWPGLTFAFLIILFGVYALIGGVTMAIIGLLSIGKDNYWWAILLNGVVSVLFGIIIFVWTGLSIATVYYLIAAWAVVTGLIELFSVFNEKKKDQNKVIVMIGGLVSVLFGIVLFAWPSPGVALVGWMIGIYALVFGTLSIAFAFRLRS